MISQNQTSSKIGLLTLKGLVHIYRVDNPDYSSSDSFSLHRRVDILELLKNQQIFNPSDKLESKGKTDL
jgi:hypothetical protein